MTRSSLSSYSAQTLTRIASGRTTRARLPRSLALVLAAALMVGVSACATTVTGATSTPSTSLSGQSTSQATQSTQQGTQSTGQGTQPTAQATQSTTTQITPTATPVPPAPPGIKEVSYTETLRGGTGGSVTASCPQGDIALGGGWTIPAQGARVYAAKVNGNSWTVSVWHDIVLLDVTAYVECLSGEPTVIVTPRAVTFTVPYTPQLGNLQAASCKTNEFPVGYGFDFGTPDANLELQATFPANVLGSPEIWWFNVANHDAQSHTITVYADCLSNTSLTATYLYGQQSAGAYSTQSTSAYVSCPGGTTLVGGGFDYAFHDLEFGNIYSTYSVSKPVSFGQRITQWLATVYVTSTFGIIPLMPQAYGVCLNIP